MVGIYLFNFVYGDFEQGFVEYRKEWLWHTLRMRQKPRAEPRGQNHSVQLLTSWLKNVSKLQCPTILLSVDANKKE